MPEAAILGTPVVVVFLRRPVARPDIKVPLILTTVEALPTEVTSPVRLALVVTFPAVRFAAVPLIFVPTKADGVPSAGVINTGDVAVNTPVITIPPEPAFMLVVPVVTPLPMVIVLAPVVPIPMSIT